MSPDYFTKKETVALLVVVLLASFGTQYLPAVYSKQVGVTPGPENSGTVQNASSPSPSEQAVNPYPNAEFPIEGEIFPIGKDSMMVRVGVTAVQVKINSATKFVERTLKPQSEVNRLLAEFDSALEKNPNQKISYPITYTAEKTLTLNDLDSGDRVLVFLTGGNMFANGEITASTIARVIR